MNREQILMGIDNMKNLREKDYATIDFLLKNTSPRLFTKIIEEVLLGNLYISDFESLLSDSQREKYNDIIQQEYEFKFITIKSSIGIKIESKVRCRCEKAERSICQEGWNEEERTTWGSREEQ